MDLATSTIVNLTLGPIVGALVAGIIGFLTVFFRDWYEKKMNKSHLTILKITRNEQMGVHVYRLAIKNEGDYVAEDLEIELVEIIENGKNRENLVPSPMRWTHIKEDISVRDIFPHQTTFLDILEVREISPNDHSIGLIELTALHIGYLKEMVKINSGKTVIRLRFYQKNGQTGSISFVINFESPDKLPIVEIIYEKTS